MDWSLYESFLSHNGKTVRERTIKEAQVDFFNDIQFSPSLHEVDIDGQKQYLKIDSTDERDKKNIRTMPGEKISLGNIITWNDMHWLVVQVDFDDTLSHIGTIQQCNRMLYWQNPKTHEIISRWCIVTKPYYSNLKEDKTVTIASGEYKITIPYDSETKLINTDKRFLIGEVDGKPQAFKVTHRDEMTGRYEDLTDSGSGFLIWNVRQDQFNYETDNVEFMIADYITIDILGSDNQNGDLIQRSIIDGRKTIKAGVGSRTYTAKFLNGDEEVNFKPIWDVVADEFIKDNLIISVIDDQLNIQVKNSKGIIGSTFDIVLSCENDLYTLDTFTVEVIGIYE